MTANSFPTLPANLAVLRGVVGKPPLIRDLPAGGTVTQFDVATEGSAGITTPVAAHDDVVHRHGEVEAGQRVIVVGRVVRRFFRSGGATASRTEVVAAEIITANKRPSTERAVWRAIERLSEPPV